MDHHKMKEFISAYIDKELAPELSQKVEEHLKTCPECRNEFKGMTQLEEVMNKMKLQDPPQVVWQHYWASIYNRLERSIGWILLSLGAMILLFFGAYKLVESIIQDPTTPVFIKVAILSFLGGLVILLVSILREHLFARKRERYKEIER